MSACEECGRGYRGYLAGMLVYGLVAARELVAVRKLWMFRSFATFMPQALPAMLLEHS